MVLRQIHRFSLIHLLTVFLSGLVTVDALVYKCPTQSCECFTEIGYIDSINVYCNVLTVTADSVSILGIPSRHTVRLTFLCYDQAYGRLTDNMFSRFTDLKALNFKNCKFDYVSKQALSGLASLENLIFLKSSFVGIHRDVLLSVPLLWMFQLSDAWIARLPNKFFCSLRRLSVFNVSGNAFSELAHMGLICETAFNNVVLLDLSRNKLLEIPSRFSALFPNLVMSLLQKNSLTHFANSSFSNLQHMTHLMLDENRLENIAPLFLQNCSALTKLSLSYNNIRNLPAELFARIPKLTFLNISGNLIGDELWTVVNKCKLIIFLDISDVNLTYINETVLRKFPMMSYLNLRKNLIRSIEPRSFKNLKSLKTLNLQNNKLFILRKQSFVGLTGLVTLDLKENYITRIHSDVVLSSADSLQFLDLRKNQLTQVPFCVRHLTKLMSLDLRINNIQNLTADSFLGLDSLLSVGLSQNRLLNIPRNVFSKCPNLRYIIMRKNFIKSLEYSAFQGMPNLERIYLDHNLISNIGDKFFGLDSVKVISLAYNKISGGIDSDMIPSNVQQLNLSHNQIGEIKPFAFTKMASLQTVDMRYNKITKLDIKSLMVSILNPIKPNLHIRFNELNCTCEITWLKKFHENSSSVTPNTELFRINDLASLQCTTPQTLYAKRLVALDDTRFLCHYETICDKSCACCEFRACDCKHVCPDNCLCSHTVDFLIHIVNCSSSHLARVPEFLSVSVRQLNLDGDSLGSLHSSTFFGLRMLHTLLLNNSAIFALSNNTFVGLAVLETLHLHDNELKELKTGDFNGLRRLTMLTLHRNKISRIEIHTFVNLGSLRHLKLNSNKLKSLDILTKVPHGVQLFLSDNPVVCYNCSTFRLFQSSVIKSLSFINDARHLGCVYNDTLHQVVPRFVHFVNAIANFCIDTNFSTQFNYSRGTFDRESLIDLPTTIVIIIITISAGFLSLFLITLIFRQRIKLVLFTYCGVRIGHDRKHDAMKKYDAFISYSSKDESFITRDLAPKLENGSPRYRLCLHYRDFPVGEGIADVIIRSIETSARTILVLSNNYVASEWCMFEFQRAHREALSKNRRSLIVIILGNLDHDLLDADLRLYLNTKTYLTVGEAWFWEKLYFALPEKSCSNDESNGRDISTHGRDISSRVCLSTISTSDGSNDYHIYEEIH